MAGSPPARLSSSVAAGCRSREDRRRRLCQGSGEKAAVSGEEEDANWEGDGVTDGVGFLVLGWAVSKLCPEPCPERIQIKSNFFNYLNLPIRPKP